MKKYNPILILFTALLLASCSPKIVALGHTGQVKSADTDRLFIVFPETVNGGAPLGEWFRYEGATKYDTAEYEVRIVITKKH